MPAMSAETDLADTQQALREAQQQLYTLSQRYEAVCAQLNQQQAQVTAAQFHKVKDEHDLEMHSTSQPSVRAVQHPACGMSQRLH